MNLAIGIRKLICIVCRRTFHVAAHVQIAPICEDCSKNPPGGAA